MKRYITLIALAVVAVSACKKKEDLPPTTMSVWLDYDSVWTENNVTAKYVDNALQIACYRGGSGDHVILNLREYQGPRPYTYEIKQGYLMQDLTKSTAFGMYNNEAVSGQTGYIQILGSSGNTLSGKFSFTAQAKRMSGTFIAPIPK